MANEEMMAYLTAPLRQVAQHHLKPGETVLTAIYTHPTDTLTSTRWWWFTGYRPVHHPARAFILTPQRALVVEDPTDPTISTADHQYVFASCPLDRVIFFEMRTPSRLRIDACHGGARRSGARYGRLQGGC